MHLIRIRRQGRCVFVIVLGLFPVRLFMLIPADYVLLFNNTGSRSAGKNSRCKAFDGLQSYVFFLSRVNNF